MRGLCLILVTGLLLASPAFADAPIRIKEPEKYITDLFGNPPRINGADIAKTISASIGKPTAADGIEKALKVLDGKKVDVFKKALDNDFGGALRQIIFYSYVEDVGFVYFRFNFKLTSTGWLLANFSFKSEGEELFPKDFVTPH